MVTQLWMFRVGRSERDCLEQGASRESRRKLSQRAALSYWLWRSQAGRVGLGNTLHASWMDARPDIDCLTMIDERGAVSMSFGSGAYF